MIALVLVLAAGMGAAQEADSPQEGGYTLGTVYVVERKSEAERLIENSPHYVSVITEDRVTGKSTSVAELLDEEVGVRVNQSGGLGSFATASIRGSSGEQVTVLLDGIPLNEALGGGVNLGTLPTSILESIEVYRGSAPLRLGVSGIGGVINIRTRRAKNKKSFLGQLQYGSFNTWVGSLFYSDKPGAYDYSIGYEHRSSDNDFEYLNDRGTPYNPDDDRVEKRQNNEFRSEDLSLRAGYDFERLRLDMINNFKTSHKGLPGTVGAPTTQAAFDTLENLTTAKAEFQATDDLFLTLKGYYAYKVEELDDRLGEVGGGNQDTRDVTHSRGMDLVADYSLGGRHTFSLLGRTVWETFNPEDALSRITVPESNRFTLTTGLEDRISLLGGRLVIVPSLRFDHVANDLRGESIGTVTRGDVGTKTYNVWSPQLSVKYTPRPFVSFRGNIGKYYRFPSFFELFGNNGTFVGNINLEPEEGTNMDVGTTLHFEWPRRMFRYCSLEVVYFRNHVKNIITFEQATGDVATAVQQDKADISGMEAAFRLGLMGHLHLSGNVTYQEAINRSPVKGKNGKQLPQRPLWQVELWARLVIWKLEPFYNYTFIDKNYLNASNIGETTPRHLHNAGITYRPVDWLTATVEVKNITDKQYEDFFGTPLPGRAYYATVRVAF